MANYTFKLQIPQRHFPGFKITVQPEAFINVFYCQTTYKIEHISITVGSQMIGKVGNWDKLVSEIEEAAKEALKSVKAIPVRSYDEDFDNGGNDSDLDDLHSLAVARLQNI